MKSAGSAAGRELLDAGTDRRNADEGEIGRVRRKRRARIGIPITIIIIVAILVGGWFGWKYFQEQKAAEAQKSEKQETQKQEENLIDQNISILITNYLTAYASADTANIKAFADPVSDAELSYIPVYTKRIDGYDGIACTRTDGATEGQYFVTVTANEIYKGCSTKLPKIFRFVVEKASDGTYKINNLYSAFNLAYHVSEQDETVAQSFQTFLKSADSTKADSQVAADAQAALASDEALKKQADATTAAVSEWNETTKNGTVIPKESAKKETTKKETSKKSAAKDSEKTKKKDSTGTAKKSTKIIKTYKAGYRAYPKESILIRKKARKSSRALATAYKGNELILLAETENGWYKIRTGKVTGYVKASYCKKKKVKLK
jgi:hypothetical protein